MPTRRSPRRASAARCARVGTAESAMTRRSAKPRVPVACEAGTRNGQDVSGEDAPYSIERPMGNSSRGRAPRANDYSNRRATLAFARDRSCGATHCARSANGGTTESGGDAARFDRPSRAMGAAQLQPKMESSWRSSQVRASNVPASPDVRRVAVVVRVMRRALPQRSSSLPRYGLVAAAPAHSSAIGAVCVPVAWQRLAAFPVRSPYVSPLSGCPQWLRRPSPSLEQ